MTLGSKLAWDDTVLPFQLDRSDMRGRVARLDGVLTGVLKQHKYPAPVQALVAEMTLLTALIGQAIDLRWKLSLQVQTNGPVRMIATDYYAPDKEGQPARIRGYASFDEERLTDGTPFEQLGKGYFAILIDQGKGMAPYQGITPIDGTSLANCAEAYFAQSEQIPTRFALSYGISQQPGQEPGWRAGGVMMQHLPKTSALVAHKDAETETEARILQAKDLIGDDAEENWNRANILLDSVEEIELIGPAVSPSELLVRLFHEEEPRVYDAQMVRFGCTCSEDRVRQSLSIYSAKDIEKMTTEEGTVTADCQFCGTHYVLDPKTVGFQANAD